MNILDTILQHKLLEIVAAKEKFPVRLLEKSELFTNRCLSMKDALMHNKTGIIAEFKRKSPSKGMINTESSLEEVTTGYFRSGAAGLSILTDNEFFGGSLADLKRARELNPIPILRKDFTIDEYQVVEAKSTGADVILLIAAALPVDKTRELSAFAHSLGLEVILEIHGALELDHLNDDIDIVGVNNRDLKTFAVDTERSAQLACSIPAQFMKISESGIHSPLTIKRLRGCGYQGFLMGENFMRSPEPAKAFSSFVELIISQR